MVILKGEIFIVKTFRTLVAVGLRVALRSLGLPLAFAFLTQCSAPISVRTETPVPPAGAPARKRDSGRQLAVVQGAWKRILTGDNSAIPIYNYEVARLIEDLARTHVNPWSAPVFLSGDGVIRKLA